MLRESCDRSANSTLFLILCCLILACTLKSAEAANVGGLHVLPNLVHIGTTFDGANVKVTGKIPNETHAVIEVIGPTHDIRLMRKGRRGGLWMNVGEMEVEGAPDLFLVASDDDQLLSGSNEDWGYGYLQSLISFTGQGLDNSSELFQQFIDLKQSEKLYSKAAQKVLVSPGGEDGSAVECSFRLPGSVRPGAYTVCMSVVGNGRLLNKECTPLQVDMVGFPALMNSMAFHHEAVYGIVAVLIAIFVGFAMGFLFKGKGGAH